MKILLIASLGLIASCGTIPGSFCAVYTPVDMNVEAATQVVLLDREAGERLATNEETHRGECQ